MAKSPHLKKYEFKKGMSGNPLGRPPNALSQAIRIMSAEQLREVASLIISGSFMQIEQLALDKRRSGLQVLLAECLRQAYKRGDINSVNVLLTWIVGRVGPMPGPSDSLPTNPVSPPKEPKTFEQFVIDAGYPIAYPKQIEMRDFVMLGDGIRLLLGARGYGKTDYGFILGVAYEIYVDSFVNKVPTYSCLLVTKSKRKNTAILNEVAKALLKNGVELDTNNSESICVKNLHGKDDSLAAITIKSTSLRGRHPYIVVMDDPVTPEDTSAATRRAAQRCYEELAKVTQNIAIVGQPVHKFDLYETIRGIVKTMEVPFGSIPELDHDLDAQRAAGISEESIQSSYFLNVLSESSTPFEGVKSIDVFPAGGSVAFIDPSHRGGDFTAVSIIKGYFDGIAVQGHVWKRAWNHCFDEMVVRLIELGVTRVCFETNALGDQPIIMLRQALEGKGIGVVGRDSTNNKHSRIMAAGAYSPKIHLCKKSDKIYLDQIIKYEYGAENDDAPDSLATGMEWIGLIKGKR